MAERTAELKAEGVRVPPAGNDIRAVVAYDHRAHNGKFVDIGHGEVAQHVGRGEYMVYDVTRHLHGVKPLEGFVSDRIGVVRQAGAMKKTRR